MFFRVLCFCYFFTFIISPIRANGLGLENTKRDMSYQDQVKFLKLQLKVLEKELKLKEKDNKIGFVKLNAALKSLTQEVRSNTENIRRSRKTNMKLSTKLNRIDGRLNDVSRNVQSKNDLVKVLNRDRCQTGEFGLYSWPTLPSWPGTKAIRFNPPFSRTPSIVHGITFLDSSNKTFLRLKVKTFSVSRFGFTLQIDQMVDTVLVGLSVRWMACR